MSNARPRKTGYVNYLRETDYHFRNLSTEEKELLDKMGEVWSITKIGVTQLSKSSIYNYALLRPVADYSKLFNLEKEVVLLFNSYETFNARSLDAYDSIYEESETLRLEKACCIMLSKDADIERKLTELLANDPELQVIVPLSYKEIRSTDFKQLMINRFRKYFFERDFFDFKAELKKELYFFGRKELVHQLIDRHKSGENTGLFGLRKTGKTSVAYAIQRVMDKSDKKAVFISCQDTSFHMRRWNEALHHVISEILKYLDFKKFVLRDESEYSEKNASKFFEEDMLRINKKLNGKSILLIFDEIENISYEISPTDHWAKGYDFIYFWQSIRANFQKHSNVFTYLIIGTNPKFVELQYIEKKENPLFEQLAINYLTGFDSEHTEKMFSVLGGLCGIDFDKFVSLSVREAYGGHPMLMRLYGSTVHRNIKKRDRPCKIKKGQYHLYKSKFDRNNHHYIKMIIEVLEEFYTTEYEMLEFLALGKEAEFREFVEEFPELINHLLGYGIIARETNDIYSFQIESVKEYILKKKKYNKKLKSDEERHKEIKKRVEKIEKYLRKHIRNQLKSVLGRTAAHECVINIYGGDRKIKYAAYDYKALFDSDHADIYFSDLVKLMEKQWDSCFKNDFGPNKELFLDGMQGLVDYRNKASEASKISQDELSLFRQFANQIEAKIMELED
jgi:hypothetical protein